MKLRLSINGMHCEHCVATITQALNHLPGVQQCSILVGSGEVTFNESVSSQSQVIDAIHDAGDFTVESFSACPNEAGT